MFHMYKDATTEEINKSLEAAWKAFREYRKMPLIARADFMRAIGAELENNADDLIQIAMRETNLQEARLKSELTRTVFQLNQYGEASEKGKWLEATIDTGNHDKKSPGYDIRKMLVPLGPVVVFGASNFPFAYSTAGGDTACAFAAGCPVIVKAHPAHAETSEMVANAILKAVHKCKMPEGIFAHIHGASVEVGKSLVMHKHTSAVGFTGSYAGGKQLFDWGNQRKIPIPVFAEMGSINPVFLLPEKLKKSYEDIAKMYTTSITQSVGQFCTNPGLIIGIESEELQKFVALLGNEIEKIAPAKMLHPGIAKAFEEKRNNALKQKNVVTLSLSRIATNEMEGTPTIATTKGETFLENPVLHQEVFGPFSLVVSCKDMNEMIEVARNLEGQLTSTLMASDNDIISNVELIESVKDICGRFILNGVPTGVQVCVGMQHGGPFPATTDSRFTSVGADGIKRFARPVAFQNWENKFLPDALKNENPLNIWRVVNNEITRSRIEN
ncbi:MAG: aldehyde dehydrogenase (NADP(+)) [Ginsengibacter sp.]